MRKPGQASLAVVIPSYNEAGTIRGVVERTLAQLPRVIVVDDGSTDGTSAALDGLPVTLIRNPRNLGKTASLWRGIALALAEDAEAVISLDGDGQHRPEDIPRLLAAHGGRGDVIVVGARLHDRQGFGAGRHALVIDHDHHVVPLVQADVARRVGMFNQLHDAAPQECA